MTWQIEKIINIATELKQSGSTRASTSEQIAAAFVLNRMDCLPPIYSDVIEAWDRLGGQWQEYVRIVKRDHMQQINAG